MHNSNNSTEFSLEELAEENNNKIVSFFHTITNCNLFVDLFYSEEITTLSCESDYEIIIHDSTNKENNNANKLTLSLRTIIYFDMFAQFFSIYNIPEQIRIIDWNGIKEIIIFENNEVKKTIPVFYSSEKLKDGIGNLFSYLKNKNYNRIRVNENIRQASSYLK